MDALIQDRIAQFSRAEQRIGATFVAGRGSFIRLWAPYAKEVAIAWENESPALLQPEGRGYHTGFFSNKGPGDRYFFILDGKPPLPDPASRFQPEGVFGRSEIVDSFFAWTPARAVPPFSQWVIYEIHTGTFTKKHNFSGIIDDLPRLKNIGITAIEIMPVSQCPGARNWGYDGAFPHAVQNTYGGPQGLKMLVDLCHQNGIAVILDVVYNHLGPEGNILFECGPYAHDKYHSLWGAAINYDGPYSDEVRRYFLQSVWQWLIEYRFDGLRLDAVQTIFDTSPMPFLEEVSRLKSEIEKIRKQQIILIAETDMNDPRLLQPLTQNGFGFDAQWADDLHHNLHVLLSGEKNGYYADYGTLEQMVRIYQDGMAFTGQYSPYRKRRHGRPYEGVDKKSLIVETQNHDQVGNRLSGERLGTLVDFEKLKLAAACVFLSPFTPLVFMGEEFACRQPFQFFINYSDNKLIDALRESRKKEWKDFAGSGEPPNPANIETFEQCVLGSRAFAPDSEQAIMTMYYKKLISLSKDIRQMALQKVFQHGNCIILQYDHGDVLVLVILSFETEEKIYTLPPLAEWCFLLQSTNLQLEKSAPVLAEILIRPFSASVLQGKKNGTLPPS